LDDGNPGRKNFFEKLKILQVGADAADKGCK